ncbi:recombinase family protein [Streptomyces spiralis]
MPTPPVRKPGAAWIELPQPRAAGAEPARHIRLGFARTSTARQSLDAQLDSLAEAGVTRIFSEKIYTRATRRPELEKAVALARELPASGVAVTIVVHEHKRLGRGIDLAALAEDLKASDAGRLGSVPSRPLRPSRPGRSRSLRGVRVLSCGP